jgi:4-hydroxybenzoate polyprenyltransferase
MSVSERVVTYGRMIRFSHSVFALPFAYAAVALASLDHEIVVSDLLWILVAMVSARSAAMGFNRLVDREIDARNPRTASRELPRGAISVSATILFVVISSAVFIFTAGKLNGLALKLAPFALFYILFYSYTKRFTWACNLLLGAAIGMAPIGAWIAVTARLSPVAVLLWVIVTLWVAGFDVVYACLDYEHDIRHGIHSIPAKWGLDRALRTAKALHAAALALMTAIFFVVSLHYVYLLGLVGISSVFVYQHSLVKSDDLSQAGRASLDLNGIVSVSYFVVTFFSVVLVKYGVGM